VLLLAFSIAVIWFAHIGMDRLVGYGLKYSGDFKHTHLGLIGRVAEAGQQSDPKRHSPQLSQALPCAGIYARPTMDDGSSWGAYPVTGERPRDVR
jgi:hypothetical protein